METKKITIRIVPKYLEELGKALDIFSDGDESKQGCVEFTAFLIESIDDNNKPYSTILVPMQQAIKNCMTNDTKLPNPQHWILGSIKLKED